MPAPMKEPDNRKPTIILVIGNISAGKTTLADSLSRVSGATRLSSDDIFQQHKKDPFPDLLRRLENTLTYGDSLIVDTTGSSIALRESISRHRSIGTQVFVVRLECSSATHAKRDSLRLDRVTLGEDYWNQSLADSRMIPPNLVIETDNLSKEEVLERVLDALPPAKGFVERPRQEAVRLSKPRKKFLWFWNVSS